MANFAILLDRVCGEEMKYLSQFSIIMIFVLLGEFVAAILPLPIAGSIYGLILLFLALCIGIVKLRWIDDVATWLLSIMALFFIGPAVAVVDIWPQIADTWWKIVILLILVYVISMIMTAVTSEFFLRNKSQTQDKKK